MDSLEILNPQIHGELRLQRDFPLSNHFVRIVPSEFAAAAVACPIFFSKHRETGAFYPGAALGLRPGELLVDRPDGKAAFESLESVREGFFATDDNISIDAAHSRFAAEDGHRLFEPDGAPAPALRRIQSALGALVVGTQEAEQFIAALLAHRLIEPLDISLSFDDGEKLSLQGLFTVSLDRLRRLDDASVLALFRAGHLQLAYTMIGSLQQVGILARRRNDRLTGTL
ncbi:SapC family protein [Sphingobium sp. BS19]|uniref:SapC family protein n=1 Tax=Sphingobium sp. BS19 TaxID=3018973 RepID=UPI0022EEB366|nr:SapC family protein [Sphingobium sp. BS19]GLI96856.1 SapC family protein [Sphingobium sp. BS19]